MATEKTAWILLLCVVMAGCNGDSPDAEVPIGENSGETNGDASVASPQPEESPPPAGAPQQTYTDVAGTRVSLVKPDGFIKAEQFPGFLQERTGASIMVTEIPGPYSEVTAGLNASQMKARGMNLLQKEEVTVDGISGVLLNIEQAAYEQTFLKWMAAFGDEKQTVMITATFPKDCKEELSAVLRGTVVGAKYAADRQVDPFADLNFTLTASEKLKFTKRIGNMLTYTTDGAIPAKSPENPLLLVGYAVSNVAVGDEKEFVRQRMLQTAQVKEIAIGTTRPITIDGLSGYETEATGLDKQTDTPMSLYQAILFQDDTYVIAQGLVGTRQRAEYFPEFKTTVQSFRRRESPPP